MNSAADTTSLPYGTKADSAAGRAVGILLVLAQLGLLAGLVRLYEVEQQRHFFPLLCLLIGGFAVHAVLPSRWRMLFFAVLSMLSVLFVLGVANGLWVLGLGAGLIGICRLPLRLRVRVLLLAAATAALVYYRDRFPAPFWPVLGSMFMFRLVLYVFEQRKQKQPEPLAETAAYLFMAPNVCFPLFPVVDYRTFRGTYDAGMNLDVRQRGVNWIGRGVVHLLLYRYLQAYCVPQPYELYDLPHVVRFMATNYALYLQVSGQFHIITGLLHLFGFDLPRTHNEYFLASSFSDIWRRINIYWKDFLTKVFFFPALYALRGRGASMNTAIVAGVFVVFVATWLLHSWQTFWLLGRFPVTANDAALWLGAGTCVAINSLWEMRRSKRKGASSRFAPLIKACQTVAMFGLVSLFWGLWTHPGFLEVLGGVLRRSSATDGAWTVLGWAAMAAAGVLVWNGLGAWWTKRRGGQPLLSFRDEAQLQLVALGLLLAVSLPAFGRLLPPRLKTAIAEFRTDAVASQAAADRLRGYYEDLNTAAIQAGPLVQSLTAESETRREMAQGFALVSRKTDPYQKTELKPGIVVHLEGKQFSVNQFGMRDRSTLSLYKPAGTVRIALLGSSIVMGYGVGDDEVFSRLLQEQLNAANAGTAPHYEVLNFGVGNQWAISRLVRLQRKVLGFEPDVLMYVAHQDELENIDLHAAALLDSGLRLPSPELEEAAKSAGITPDMKGGAIQGRLHPFRAQLLGAAYRSMVNECRRRGVRPVYVYLPMPGSTADDNGAELLSLARDAGFQVADLTGWLGDTPAADLFRTEDTQHPNAIGHRLIAAALSREFEQRKEWLSAEDAASEVR